MKFRLYEILCSVFVVLVSCTGTTTAADTLSFSQSITSNETLISAQKQFELGFFSPGNSTKYFLAIWYNVSPTQIVWIANRDNPLNDTSGVLSIGDDGNLMVLDKTPRIIWSTELQNLSSRNISAQLLDSGNLVLRDNEDGSIRWQSFDHPSHTLIAGMKLGWDLKTGLNRNLTSWKTSDDPSPGEYTYGVDLHGPPQLIIWKGSSKRYRTGPWNGVYFGGLPFLSNFPFTSQAVINSEEVYYVSYLRENSSLVISSLSYNGVLQILLRDNNTKDWNEMFKVPQDSCGDYGYCGPNAICTISGAQLCTCMIGYVPKFSQEWDVRFWSNGCIRKTPLNCSEAGHFKEFQGLKMPDFLEFRVNLSMSVEECEAECLTNCSCTAYANADANGAGHGCLLWYEDLIDVRTLNVFPNQNLYIWVTASDLVSKSDSKKKKKILIIAMTISASILLLLVVLLFIWKRKSRQEGGEHSSQVGDEENLDLPCFDIVTTAGATQNFSDMNKIGEGGFGPVYKGKLSNGQEIAVKRLSEQSRQGLTEFKNEVVLIAKLQHRNLVRLLGCCIHGEERMLIYEYMPNGSLDAYIFGGSNRAKSRLLVWRRRFAIIVGIARGLLYLHRDSRLRIIHRDLKASNVLLDSEMNPKISDFGMARTFGEGQSTTQTKTVVGTFGYMAPEYAIDGIYSMKSDVFSFGVLVLEIVSGKRNSQFHHPDHDFNLLGHAWQLLLEGKASDLIDPLMEDQFPISEVMRCIQIGLLCVQQRPEDRPTMPSVLLMLDSESAMLPQPKRPGFFTERYFSDSDSLLAGRWTSYDVTISRIDGR